MGGVALEIFLTRKYKSKPLMVTLALTAENRSLLAKVRKAEPGIYGWRGKSWWLPAPASSSSSAPNAYNERVKTAAQEKLAEKKDA